MIGAPALVANAALRSGAGLVTVACPESIQRAVATLCPCATTIPLPEDASHRVAPARAGACLRAWGASAPGLAPSVVAAGPGLGSGSAAFASAWHRLVVSLCEDANIPVVLDADALNALAALPERRRTPLCNAVLTPHPGEMARLMGSDTATVQRQREETAVRCAGKFAKDDIEGAVVVALKGAKTVVTDGVRRFTNGTGNPGMATGGSGDVLTGIIAALVAQGMSRFDATVLGVHVHGLAGDLAALHVGQPSLIATDLIEHLPAAFRDVESSRHA